jgi:Tfp pilus assembly protein PilF
MPNRPRPSLDEISKCWGRYPSAAKPTNEHTPAAERYARDTNSPGYLRAGKVEQGESAVLKWLNEHPTDAATRSYLAGASIKASRLPTAVAQYEWLAQNKPDNQDVLNNLAWAYNETGDPRAVATAEKAFRMNENNAAVCDTYGWALYQNARVSEALEMLKRAVTLAECGNRRQRPSTCQIGGPKNARQELERVQAAADAIRVRWRGKPCSDG